MRKHVRMHVCDREGRAKPLAGTLCGVLLGGTKAIHGVSMASGTGGWLAKPLVGPHAHSIALHAACRVCCRVHCCRPMVSKGCVLTTDSMLSMGSKHAHPVMRE
jgi:hypothetical protein